jgi:hypothetical protein
MQNKKNVVVALSVAGILVAVGAIYLLAAYEEPIEAAEESGEEVEGGGIDDVGAAMNADTMVQTAFFYIAGVANLGVAGWVIASRKRMSTAPYAVTAIGSAFLIVLYIASRTVSLPVVGIQDDIGTTDIISKILQGIVIGLSVYAISISRRLNEAVKNRMT